MAYYRLTKPGIIYGNDLSALAGFLLAASIKDKFSLGTLVATLGGISAVIACGCVINNVIDRGLDKKMARTSSRAVVTGKIRPLPALIYALVLGVIGFSLLLAFVNGLTALIGAVGLFFYLVMYSFWKRRSPLGTIVGSVSGATPITAGYTALTGHFDGGAALLFLSMTFWQMPHFYAIAMYRFKDYQAAGLPVLPVARGNRRAKLAILAYIAAFTLCACSLSVFGYTGLTYLVVMVLVGAAWFIKGARGFAESDETRWGKQMFFRSLLVLLVFCAALPLGALLP